MDSLYVWLNECINQNIASRTYHAWDSILLQRMLNNDNLRTFSQLSSSLKRLIKA